MSRAKNGSTTYYPENKKDELVYTPYGQTKKSNIHNVDNNHKLRIKDGSVQVVNLNTKEIRNEYSNIVSSNKFFSDKNASETSTDYSLLDSSEVNGWLTHASGIVFLLNPKPITFFRTRWVVPSPPPRNDNQLLYIFNALGGVTTSGLSHIVQPVLQWGKSPAGGGNYWAICNWYVNGNNLFFHDSLRKVSPGISLEGVIRITSSSDSLFSYNSAFTGYGSGLQIDNLPNLSNFYEAFEGFDIDDCTDYPLDEKIRMNNIRLETESITPPIIWHTFEEANEPVNSCKQFTKIVNPSSVNGEIEIHFHIPTSINDFSDIHIYPNPVTNILHVSPNISLFNCKLELFNASGVLVLVDFYKTLTNEFNIDFQNYPAGIYFIRFSYNSKIHTFKFVKIPAM